MSDYPKVLWKGQTFQTVTDEAQEKALHKDGYAPHQMSASETADAATHAARVKTLEDELQAIKAELARAEEPPTSGSEKA